MARHSPAIKFSIFDFRFVIELKSQIANRKSQIRAARGFTLAESLIASVVLALAVVSIATGVSASFQQAGLLNESSTALELGRQLLEEIAAKPFVDPRDGSTTLGPESGETSRSLYDNADDYNGFTDSTASNATTP